MTGQLHQTPGNDPFGGSIGRKWATATIFKFHEETHFVRAAQIWPEQHIVKSNSTNGSQFATAIATQPMLSATALKIWSTRVTHHKISVSARKGSILSVAELRA